MFWKKFYFLCEQKNMKPLQVVKDIGIAHGNITNWKNGKTPSGTNLAKIADYFGVTVDYLLGKEDSRPEEPPQRLYEESGKVHMIPLYETVSAGFGALARDEVVDYIPLCFDHPSESKQTICIRVRGDSMSPTIEDGDTIQVRKQDSVDNGSIAVVLIDGDEGLVKRVEYGENWIELHSINPSYKVIRRNGADAENVRIVGLVTKIIKNVRNRKIGYIPSPEEYDEAKSALFADINNMDDDQIEELNNYVEFLKNRKNKSR